MRVLLVKPNSKSDSIVPPVGLGYLATQIRDRHQVEITNCLVNDRTVADLMEIVRRFEPDLIGFQLYSSDRAVVREYLRALGRAAPRPILVVGGPHPSAVPEKVLDEFAPDLDFAFAGEAELGFASLLDRLAAQEMGDDVLQGVSGLIWRDTSGQPRVNPSFFHEEIDHFGNPSWDLLRPEGYPHAPYASFVLRLPVAPVVASRGCAYRCTFCSAGYLSGHRVRYRDPEAIVGEIEMLSREHGIREIQFTDDNLAARPEVVAQICELMIARKLDMPWSCPNGVRIDSLDRELLALMKRAGCHSLAVGIETGSRRLLKMIRKGYDPELVHDRLALIKEVGIMTIGYFIFGLPTETPLERQQTTELALSLPLDVANFMLYCPLPGTPLYEQAKQSTRFNDSETYSFASPIYVPAGATAESLVRDQRAAFLRFYLRPHQMRLLLGSIRSPAHFAYVAQRTCKWMLGLSLPPFLLRLNGQPQEAGS